MNEIVPPLHLVMNAKTYNKSNSYESTKVILPQLLFQSKTQCIRCPNYICNVHREAFIAFAKKYDFQCILYSSTKIHYVENIAQLKHLLNVHKNDVIMYEHFFMPKDYISMNGFRLNIKSSQKVCFQQFVLSLSNTTSRAVMNFQTSSIDEMNPWVMNIEKKLKHFYYQNRRVLSNVAYIDVCSLDNGKENYITDFGV